MNYYSILSLTMLMANLLDKTTGKAIVKPGDLVPIARFSLDNGKTTAFVEENYFNPEIDYSEFDRQSERMEYALDPSEENFLRIVNAESTTTTTTTTMKSDDSSEQEETAGIFEFMASLAKTFTTFMYG